MKLVNFDLKDFEQSKHKKWMLGNNILYKLCKEHSPHTDEEEIRAKIWLIGRSYAAAIERRSKKYNKDINDNFYDYVVKEFVQFNKKFNLDARLKELETKEFNKETLKRILLIHNELTKFFKELTGKEKRSLASKYLHFHVPLFPIYDSRANNAINDLVKGKINISEVYGDKDYSKFSYKILFLFDSIRESTKDTPTLREIDTFLINLANKKLKEK